MLTTALHGVVAVMLTAFSPGDGSAVDTSTKRLDFLGLSVCVGDLGDGEPCHVKLFPDAVPADRAEADPVPVQLSLLGTQVCIGAVPAYTPCDVRLPNEATDSGRVGA